MKIFSLNKVYCKFWQMLNMNGYTFREGNTAIIFVSLLNEGQLSRQDIVSTMSRFFPVRVEVHLDRFYFQGIQTKSQQLFPL